MEIIRKCLKVYCIATFVFICLSFAFAAIIKWTPLSEEWSRVGIITVLSISVMVSGYLEGVLIGKKGFFVGMVTSIIYILIILFFVKMILVGRMDIDIMKLQYVVPLVLGVIGAIVGTNKVQ